MGTLSPIPNEVRPVHAGAAGESSLLQVKQCCPPRARGDGRGSELVRTLGGESAPCARGREVRWNMRYT